MLDFEALFEDSPNPYMVVDRELHYVAANRAYREVTGSTRDELIGKRITDVFPHDPADPSNESRMRVEASIERVFATGETVEGHAERAQVRDPDGSTRDIYVDFVYQLIRGPSGAPLGVLVSGTQLAFETEARHLAKVLDRTRDFVGISSLDGIPRFVNAAGLELLGVPDMATLRTKRIVEYFAPECRELFQNEVVPAVLRDGYWAGEVAFLHQQTGERIPVTYDLFTLPDHAGRPSSIATISRDLRAQKAAEAERAALLAAEQAARAQAEQANRIKDEFLATISHELRTPLAAILGWVQMLRSGTLSVEKRERALEVVERNARTQAQLIEDLLGRIISGKLDLEMAPTSITAVVQAGLETVRPSADARGVKLVAQVRTNAKVQGDHARLQQVVWNLLSNAVKFTPPGGSVSVSVEQLGDQIEIRVADTGAGIASEFLPHVFERFRQSEGGPARKLGGLGLGLSIVHHVVTAHGGTVHADSDGPSHGATFTVRLPVLRDTATRVPAVRHFTPPTSLTGMRILVVDDEEDTREYVRMLLTMCNARVSVADSAQTALALVQAEPRDVLVSDIAMPEQDGYRLIRQVRSLPADHGGTTPAVALTAYARVEDRTRAMLAGFQNHVTKPIEPAELIAVIASLDRRPRA